MALTVGLNSYKSLADADAYFLDSIRGGTWAAYTADMRSSGLVEATRVLERQKWKGEKEISTQALAFGLTGLTGTEGESLTPAETLDIAGEGQFEYAFALLADATILDSNDATGTNIKQLKAGSAGIEYFRATKGSRFPVIVMDILGAFLLSSGAALGVTPTVDGTCVESGFTDRDAFGYTGPL